MSNYHDNFGLYLKKKDKVDKLQYKLFQIPTKDHGANMPHLDPAIQKGTIHFADLLTMPNDGGYKYILVVADAGSRYVDGEPIKNKESKTVLLAFKTIYERKYLKGLPTTMLQVDSGSEFKGVVAQHFKDNNIIVKVAKAGRHRQVALVEAYNGVIAKALFNAMYAKEIETNKTNKNWVDNLPKVIKLINKNVQKKQKKFRKLRKLDKSPSCDGDSCKLLEIGTKVHAILDEPREYIGNKKLIGKFRATDMRFDPIERKVEQIILRPNNPPMYKVSGIKHVAYTKNQLQIT